MISIGSDEWTVLLSYMHLEGLAGDDPDAALIQEMYSAAEGYLEDAGITAETVADGVPAARRRMILRAMTLDMFDNRDAVSGGAADDAAVAVRHWINQLKMRNAEEFL